MEVVYIDTIAKKYKNQKNKIIGVYGDLSDLIDLEFNINGISYDDEWKVSKLLCGKKLFKRKNEKVMKVLEFLEMDSSILNVKINTLSNTNLKYVLLAYLLINNKKIIVFDYFDVGLSYNDKKKFSKLLRIMKLNEYTSYVISNDLVYLASIVDSLMIVKNKTLVYNGLISDLDISLIDELPNILKFIECAKKKGVNLNTTFDSRELLKDIYRSEN